MKDYKNAGLIEFGIALFFVLFFKDTAMQAVAFMGMTTEDMYFFIAVFLLYSFLRVVSGYVSKILNKNNNKESNLM